MYRTIVELERELADLDLQSVAAGSAKKKKRAAGSRRGWQPEDSLRPMLRILREAEQPLPPREIASRLGIKPKVASRRLARAAKLGLVERVGNARYRAMISVQPVPGL